MCWLIEISVKIFGVHVNFNSNQTEMLLKRHQMVGGAEKSQCMLEHAMLRLQHNMRCELLNAQL